MRTAKSAGLRYIAVTDHDTMNGLRRLRQATLFPVEGIEIIPGIEFSAHMPEHEVHILGYHIDLLDTRLQAKLDEVVKCRWTRFDKIVEKLWAMGYAVTREDIMALAGNTESIGRAHIARALVDKGYFNRLGEVFVKVLHKNGPAYVPHYRLESEEIIHLIRSSGGVAVVAHPGLIGDDTIVADLIAKGIDGIEVFHPKHSQAECEKYRRLALMHGLLATGGSDYHGIPTRYPNKIGMFTIEDKYAMALNEKVKLLKNSK